jgi:hypothetical protein
MDNINSSHPAAPAPDVLGAKPRFGGILAAIAVGVTLSTLALVFYMRKLQVRRETVEIIAPGLSLRREILKTPAEDMPILILRADPGKGWKLRFVPAAENALKLRSVSEIAADYNARHNDRAPVAINGGFFAYEGGAVGAVKVEGEWQRLPWKNRTAIGWDDGARPTIDNISARAFVRTAAGEIPVSNLNGRAGEAGCALLTWRFGNEYKLAKGEVAAIIREGKIAGLKMDGKLPIARGEQVLVAGAKSAFKNAVALLKAGEAAEFEVVATPEKWNSTRTILGAGPRLVAGGQIKTTEVEEEFKPDVLGRGPRTMIGVDKDGALIVMVIEAWFARRQRGMTLPAAASEMQRAGAVDAINLDGGSSTTMWVRGKTITAASELVEGNQILENASDRRDTRVANAVLIEKSE